MPLGMVLADWNNQIGPKILAVSPKGFEISSNEINKLLMTHSISDKREPEIIEIHIREHILLSFSCKDKITTKGYGMVILVLSLTEEERKPEIKKRLYEMGHAIFEKTGYSKIKLFRAYSQELFTKISNRKILFIGPSGVGKSTIKSCFFEGVSSDELLSNPLEPTYGVEFYNYSWLDLDIGIADLAGQEIDRFLEESNGMEMNPFTGADVVLYIIDSSKWNQEKAKILEYFQKLKQKVKDLPNSHQISLICHKLDLIPIEQRDAFKQDIELKFSNSILNSIYFTSIQSTLMSSLIRTMQSILGSLSSRMSKIEKLFFTAISNYSTTAVILFNSSKIQLEVSTHDFPLISLDLIRKFYHNNFTFLENLGEKQKDFGFIAQNCTIMTKSLISSSDDYILLLSKSLDLSKLDEIANSIQRSLISLDTDNFS